MTSCRDLERAVREGLEAAGNAREVAGAEVFASENASWIARLNYTSHIPSNGVEEPKSLMLHGVGVRAIFKTKDGDALLGFGSEACDLSVEGVLRALEKARVNAVADPDFRDFPHPPPGSKASTINDDEKLDTLGDKAFVDLAWKTLGGSVETFSSSGVLNTVIIGGDLSLVSERMAIANTRGVFASDRSALLSASVTAMIEREHAKGSGWTCASCLDAFRPEEAGREAALAAVAARGGKRTTSGRFPVIFGPQAVADLLNHLIVPSLALTAFYESASPFMGRWGEIIADPRVRISDDGTLPDAMGTKRVTCEGVPTGRTELVRDGRLVGLLSDAYSVQKCLADPEAVEKLGRKPDDHMFEAGNGFRYGQGGGRRFDRPPSIAPTNLLIESSHPEPRETLLSRVGDGLYIGRIWYTYPINGLAAGDFTTTVVGDSFLIRNGKIVAPLLPNTVRINDNIKAVLMKMIGMTERFRPTILWASDEVFFAPEIAVSDLRLDDIAGPSA